MNPNVMVFIQEIIYLKYWMGAYIINLDQYKTIETYWIALYVKDDNVTYFER